MHAQTHMYKQAGTHIHRFTDIRRDKQTHIDMQRETNIHKYTNTHR